MIQYKLRSLLILMTSVGVFIAGWMHFPLVTSAAAIVWAAVVARVIASQRLRESNWLWVISTLSATTMMLGCIFVSSLQVSVDGAQIGWSRAVPISLLCSMAVGTIVAAADNFQLWVRSKFSGGPTQAVETPAAR